jgi:hypothetical protein
MAHKGAIFPCPLLSTTTFMPIKNTTHGVPIDRLRTPSDHRSSPLLQDMWSQEYGLLVGFVASAIAAAMAAVLLP